MSRFSIRYAKQRNLKEMEWVHAQSYNMRFISGDMRHQQSAGALQNEFAEQELASEMKRADFHVLLARHPRSVGYLTFTAEEQCARIMDFYTLPSVHHYGRRLMDHFTMTAKQMGLTHAFVCPSVFAAEKKIYEKLGFQPFSKKTSEMIRVL
jgi:N-acetylglutamate synthase-like GNAT family acetyltransferase